MCKSLPLPRDVAKRRALEVELEKKNSLEGLPQWPLRIVFKLFRNYDAPYPLYTRSTNSSAANFTTTRSVIGDDDDDAGESARNAARESDPPLSPEMLLRVEIIRGEDLPQMDATGLSTKEGCDPYVVLRYEGLEVFRTRVQSETYRPVWNETFCLRVRRAGRNPLKQLLTLQVWDEDETCNELIGQNSINFLALPPGVRSERWHTITAESYKAFRAVRAKADTSHAGRVLLAMTLSPVGSDSPSERGSGTGAGSRPASTASAAAQIDLDPDGGAGGGAVRRWGYLAASDFEAAAGGRRETSARQLLGLLLGKLRLILSGINVTSKPHLFSALDSLLISQARWRNFSFRRRKKGLPRGFRLGSARASPRRRGGGGLEFQF